MPTNQDTNKQIRKKTARNLDMFIRMTILGLMANKNYPGLGKVLKKSYEETFGNL